MTEPAIGIDLGTSTSEVCVYQSGSLALIPDPSSKSPIIPSLVAVNPKGHLLIGEEARSFVDRPGFGVREAKRKMGTDEIFSLGSIKMRPEEVSATILRKIKSNAETFLNQKISRVVLSVPANFNDAARNATKNAAELAGLEVLQLISEPTAAALAFGISNLDLEARILVFDFGGGTLDISVLEMIEGVLDVTATHGDPMLGGKDFDEAIAQHILNKFRVLHPNAEFGNRERLDLKEVAETAKKALSTSNNHFVERRNFAKASNGELLDLELEITRREFESSIEPLLEKCRICCMNALGKAKISRSEIDKVLLVGGTTYVPSVKQLVEECFGRAGSFDVNPDLAVAMGAAVSAAINLGYVDPRSSLIVSDVVAYGLGVEILTFVGDHPFLAYDSLIAPNTTVPFSVNKQYTLLHADQREVQIRLFEDHSGLARLASEATFTGIQGVISDIPPALYGEPHPVEVTFTYDKSHTVSLKAVIPGIGKSVEIKYSPNSNRMSEDQKMQALNSLDALYNAAAANLSENEANWDLSNDLDINRLAKFYQPFVEKAIELKKIYPDDKERLEVALRNLSSALRSQNPAHIHSAGQELTSILFELDEGG